MTTKNLYQEPQTTVVDITIGQVLMISGGDPTPTPGNINNNPLDDIIGG